MRSGMLTKDDIIQTLKQCHDPELGLDIYTLGLIYDVIVDDTTGDIAIKMTFTTPLCPFGPLMVDDMKEKLRAQGAKKIDVHVVFDPPWKPTPEVRTLLGV